MSSPDQHRSVPARVAGLLFDRAQAWRMDFLVLRGASRFGNTRHLATLLDNRFRSQFPERPGSIFPYLRFTAKKRGLPVALEHLQAIVDNPEVSAAELVEAAKYLYSCGRFARGDSLIERAKGLEPNLPRIYDEEAWNHRSRGNLHRELQAVRHSVELAQNPTDRLRWEMWLGETYLRMGEPLSAWETLQRFKELPERDASVYSAAYCASLLGNHEAAQAAYAHASPSDDGGVDRLNAARTQLERFGRAAEVLSLLEDESVAQTTEARELCYRAHLRLGEVDLAQASLEVAATRPDRSTWVRGTLAQLFHLSGDLVAASGCYATLAETERDALHDSLRATVLAQLGQTESAVRAIIGSSETVAHDLTFPLAPEVDPQIPGLVEVAVKAEDPDDRRNALADLLPRLSNPTALSATAYRLAQAFARDRRWDDAWDAIRHAHGQRLPAVSLGLRDSSLTKLSWEMQYAEWAATEPVQPNTVLYESSLGESTSCNPLAICLELLRDPARAHLTHVWSITTRATIAPELLRHPRVRFVRKGSIGHMRYLATAGYLINNATWETCFARRPEQRALNTWHGVPWKTLGRDLETDSFAYGNVARSLLQADLILVPDPHTLDVLTRGMSIDGLVRPESLMLGGYPRNDLAKNLSPEKRSALRDRIGVTGDDHLVVFMPTWKGLFNERNAEVQETLAHAREMSAPGRIVALRAHQYVREAFADTTPPPGVRFVPEDIDTNELLGASDVLVTDFSSVLFDAAAVGVPVVLLTESIDTYREERGLYFSPDEVPGVAAQSAGEARGIIGEAISDRREFVERYSSQTSRFSAEESGQSASRAIRAFFDGEREPVLIHRQERPLLLATGGLPPNGITRAARSLLWALDGSGFRPYLPLTANSMDTATPETLEDVKKFARVLPSVGRPAGTRMEREVLRFFSTRDFTHSTMTTPFLESGRKFESRRLFGATVFAAAVEYGAYDSQSIALMAFGVPIEDGRRGVILHSEMRKEVTSRYPKLRSGMSSLGAFDFIASVSEGVRRSNTEYLSEQFGISAGKSLTLENTINIEEILAGSQAQLEEQDLRWYAQHGAHVCMVGRLSPEKNQLAFIDAYAKVMPSLSRPVYVSILGDGPLMIELRHRVAAHGLEDRIRFLGLVGNPYAHIRACDTLFLPSLHEGQPLVILESLTLGTPVVATDIPGSRSVLQNGRLGNLVDLSDQGLAEGIRLIADNRVTPADAFDPVEFTRSSRDQFVAAISGSLTVDPTVSS